MTGWGSIIQRKSNEQSKLRGLRPYGLRPENHSGAPGAPPKLLPAGTGAWEVLAAAVDQQENEERQQGSGGSPAPGGGNAAAAAAAAKTRAAVQAEVQHEHAARIATEADGSLVAWTEDVHEQVAAADACHLPSRPRRTPIGGWPWVQVAGLLPLSLSTHHLMPPSAAVTCPSVSASACLSRLTQADAARAAAREAYRSDQRSESKGAEWHARVADAQQV